MPEHDRDRRADRPEPHAASQQHRPPPNDAVYALQRAAGNSAVGALLHGSASGPVVVQRVLDVAGDGRYGTDDVAAFEARYGAAARKEMLEAIGASDWPQLTIEAALASDRHFRIRHTDEGYVVDDAEKPRVTADGHVWETTSWPRAIAPPDAGSVGLDFTGLIQCLGVLAERRDGERVAAAAGLHFVTPDLIAGDGTPGNPKRLSGPGRAALDALLAMVAGQERSVTLMRQTVAAAASAVLTGDQRDSETAAALVTAYVEQQGVTVIKRPGGSTVGYRLSADGAGTLE